MQIGQLVLRADGQLLDHELEVVVARQRDDRPVGIGGADAERGGERPAEGTRLPAVDPVARIVDMQKLGAGDLRQPDRRDVARVAVKTLVHLLIHALRLERDVVKMAVPQHVLLAMQAFGGPG